MYDNNALETKGREEQGRNEAPTKEGSKCLEGGGKKIERLLDGSGTSLLCFTTPSSILFLFLSNRLFQF